MRPDRTSTTSEIGIGLYTRAITCSRAAVRSGLPARRSAKDTLAIGVFLAISFPMSGFGRPYHDRLWHALDPQGHAPPTKKEPRRTEPATTEELLSLLGKGRPMLLTAIGVVGLGVILWLMMFKPF